MKDRLHELHAIVGVKYTNHTECVEIDVPNSELTEVLKEIGKIRQWIDEINEKTKEMRALYSNATFATSNHLQSEMDSLVTTCTVLGMKSCGALREFNGKLTQLNEKDVTFRIAKIQYITTKQLYCNSLAEHNNFLTKYKQSRMALLRQQIKLTNQMITEEECESLLESNKVSIFVNNYEADTRESKLALQDVETRHRELIKIENALKGVQEMFTQLAFLVQQQQEQIDTVEYFATRATGYVENGNEQLQIGFKSHVKSNKKKISIFICLIVGIIILLLILFVF